MPRYATANDIINRAAVEVGLNADVDPLASSDETFVQMTALLNNCGDELVNLHDWGQLINEIDFTTNAGDSGIYPLPEDFDHMIDQTGWDRKNRVALGGPLSAQDWTYLKGRDLVSQTIYASFRLSDNRLNLFPQPPPEGLRITFEYVSNYWVFEQGSQDGQPTKPQVETGSDVVAFDALLIKAFLKLKFLNAKGLPAQDAAMEFDSILDSRTGKNAGASILSAGNISRGTPYLNPWRNVGDSGFGNV